MSRVIRRPRLALTAVAVVVALLAGPASVSAAKTAAGELGFLLGLSSGPSGTLYVSDGFQGIVAINGESRTLVAALPNVTDAEAVGAGNLYAITGGGPEASDGSVYRIANGHSTWLTSLWDYEQASNPDGRQVESNPFDVEVLSGGGVLVADAAGNDVLYVTNRGEVDWIATLPVEDTSTANVKALVGCPAPPPEFADLCFLPATIPTDPVATGVAIGPDGAAYVSELKGFPGPVGESKIWRIEPGARHVECGVDPECTVVGDGFTSIVDLNFGPDGTLYVTEIDESSFLAPEFLMAPGLGGTINACAWGSFPFVCTEVATELPIPTATAVSRGTLYTTIWSLVPGMADVIAVE